MPFLEGEVVPSWEKEEQRLTRPVEGLGHRLSETRLPFPIWSASGVETAQVLNCREPQRGQENRESWRTWTCPSSTPPAEPLSWGWGHAKGMKPRRWEARGRKWVGAQSSFELMTKWLQLRNWVSSAWGQKHRAIKKTPVILLTEVFPKETI